MKKTGLTFSILLVAATAFAQGTVYFNNRLVGSVVTKVYEPDPVYPYLPQAGNTPADWPPGTNVYNGAPLSGEGWTAELWYAPWANAPESSLMPATPKTVFRTGAAAGFVMPTTVTLLGVPPDAPWATMQLRVYPSYFSSWASAEYVWLIDWSHPDFALGRSPMFNLSNIGGVFNLPPDPVGLVSFSLITRFPEPSPIALTSLGALVVLAIRYRR